MKDHADIAACAECLCLASRRAALAITRNFERHMRAHGVRITQFTILTNLMLRGPMLMGEVAAAVGVERTTLTRNLAVIAREGWIRIDPGDDARARIVSVTAAGARKVEEAYTAWRKAQDEAAAALGAGGTAALKRLAAKPIA